MTVAAATPLSEAVTPENAREELSKFFAIADIAEQVPEMFSRYIDAEWHRLMETGDYSRFCIDSVGHLVGHKEGPGYGPVSWVDLYHERYGTLPAAWFASAEGIVVTEAYVSYLGSQTTSARFDCTPTTPDPDMTSQGFITSWDCTPAPPDPDVKPKGKPGFITSRDCTPEPADPDFAQLN